MQSQPQKQPHYPMFDWLQHLRFIGYTSVVVRETCLWIIYYCMYLMYIYVYTYIYTYIYCIYSHSICPLQQQILFLPSSVWWPWSQRAAESWRLKQVAIYEGVSWLGSNENMEIKCVYIYIYDIMYIYIYIHIILYILHFILYMIYIYIYIIIIIIIILYYIILYYIILY